MRIIVNGISGRMGGIVAELLVSGYRNSEAAAGVDIRAYDCGIFPCYCSFDAVKEEADAIIDFSHHAGTEALLRFAVAKKMPIVLATTGHTDEERAMIEEAAKEIPIFMSANMSLGVALLAELAAKTAAIFPDADLEIIEKHHNRKLDAPSGTALMIADAIMEVKPDSTKKLARSGHGKRTPGEIGIHSVRMGNIVGIHEVIVGTANQTITLKHEAHDRALFAEGGLAAAAFITGAKAGLYDMSSLVAEQSEQ